jgi:hypothetical protein
MFLSCIGVMAALLPYSSPLEDYSLTLGKRKFFSACPPQFAMSFPPLYAIIDRNIFELSEFS